MKPDNTFDPTRRQVVGGLATGMAAAMAAPAFAQSSSTSPSGGAGNTSNTNDSGGTLNQMQDPKSKYPTPPL